MTDEANISIVHTGENMENEYYELIERHPEVRYLDVITADSCARVRGKRIPIAEAKKVYTTGVQIPESTYVLNVDGSSSDPCGRGFDDGDPDGTLLPIPGRTHIVPWYSIPTAQVLTRLFDDEGGLCMTDPRNIAEEVVNQLNSLGYSIEIAFELEFYLLSAELAGDGSPQLPKAGASPSNAGIQVYSLADLDERFEFLDRVLRACESQRIPASVMSSEFAPSQYEINLRHVDNPLEAADHCVLLRRVVQETAKSHNMCATFMSKPFMSQAGSGMHVHLSMRDQAGDNVFRGRTSLGSDTMRYAVGGLLQTIPDMFAVFAANINAYRRFVPDIFVPVNPSWGVNNRSLAVRIPAGDDRSRRLEHRVAGADANPYLVLAAILAGVHYGIGSQSDPGEPSGLKNMSGHIDPSWPMTWRDALERFRTSKFARAYLTNEYVDLYYELKRGEMEEFHSKITDREYQWYL